MRYNLDEKPRVCWEHVAVLDVAAWELHRDAILVLKVVKFFLACSCFSLIDKKTFLNVLENFVPDKWFENIFVILNLLTRW